MKIEQIYTGCLAHGAYYIESNGEVAIIDPLREVDPYIERAEKDGAKIKYILETHFHADFVSGHLTLAEKTGATIVYGPTAQPSFDAMIATDNQELKLGEVTLVVLHTPGHTMESSSFLLRDADGNDFALFSGDTLFLGDVGRPDLAQKAANMTQEELAGLLHDSLQSKIVPLADDILVYPGHGAGSACGKNMMDITQDTLGNQKKTNYALREGMTRDEFIQEVTEGLMAPPAYFPLNAKLNKEGYVHIDEVMERSMRPLSPPAFEAAAEESGAVVLDIRTKEDFAQGHIPRSTFIGIDGDFAPWSGALIRDVEQPILLIAENNEKVTEAITRLSRVGFDHVLGYLEGGFQSWKRAGMETDNVTSTEANAFADGWDGKNIFDVRKPGEYKTEHVMGAASTPLDYLNDHLAEFPRDKEFYIHCKSGYRSMIAASMLKARGIHNFVDIKGGMEAIAETPVLLTEKVNA
jgi:hydroxyacylglutathione hydrolase